MAEHDRRHTFGVAGERDAGSLGPHIPHRVDPSSPPVAKVVPSGLNATDVTSREGPVKVARDTPTLVSQRRTVPSLLPVARGGAVRTEGQRLDRLGVTGEGGVRLAGLHVPQAYGPPPPPTARVLPSGLNATVSTSCM